MTVDPVGQPPLPRLTNLHLLALARLPGRSPLTLHQHVARHRCTPSFGEMCAAIGMASKSSIGRLLDGLEEPGHIGRRPGRWRVAELLAPVGLGSEAA